MGDELLRKSKQLVAEIETKNVEYIQSLELPSDMEFRLHSLLQTKEDLEAGIMALNLQQMILKELGLPLEEMLTEKKIEKNIAESKEILSESKAVCDENLSKVEATNQAMVEALDRLNLSLHALSQKITALEDKYAAVEKDLQESGTFGNNSVDPSTNKRAKERALLLLDGAKEERDLIEKRITRLKSLHQLAENTATCLQSDEDYQLTLTRLQNKLTTLEFLSGIKCTIIDDMTVAVHFVDPDTLKLPDDAKLVVTLSFTPDESQCLELSALNTNIKIPEVETIVESIRNDTDLPKVIRSLRKAWLSHVALLAEISSLRESHAIDWKLDNRVFHLMIAKYICRFSIPSSYPCNGGCVTLEQIMGGPSNLTSVTEENVPPSNTSLTGWVTHLENMLA